MTERQEKHAPKRPEAGPALSSLPSVSTQTLPELFTLMEAHRDLDKDLSRGFEQLALSSAKSLRGSFLSVSDQQIELGEPLGAGAGGIVFAASRLGDTTFNLALKVGQPYVSSGKRAPERDSPQRRFEQEVRALTILQNAEDVRVPKLFGSSEVLRPGSGDNQRMGLILMELVPGERMNVVFASALQNSDRATQLPSLCAKMLEGISAMLKKGICVEDAGVYNTMVTPDKSQPIVLFDFGTARIERVSASARRDTEWFVGDLLETSAMTILMDRSSRASEQAQEALRSVQKIGKDLKQGTLTLEDAPTRLRQNV